MSVLSLKEVQFYNLRLVISYLKIRYKVYIKEFKRKIIGEFNLKDLKAKHYIFFNENQAIGISRVVFKENIAELGRVAILKEYRKLGYGKKLINQIIADIKSRNKAETIQLYTENKNLVNFYQQFGFKNIGKIYFEGWPPCILMKKHLKKL